VGDGEGQVHRWFNGRPRPAVTQGLAMRERRPRRACRRWRGARRIP
jgi:hypothetical protein